MNVSCSKLIIAICACLTACTLAHAQVDVQDESYFIDKVYPALKSTQCHLCHNDNGVASATSIQFPSLSASRDQIAAFGYQLIEFVNPDRIDESPLLLKPTNRQEHTGGERIKPDGQEEQFLKAWIQFLVAMNAEQRARSKQLIDKAGQWQLEPLSVQRLTHSQYNNTVRDLLGDQSQPANSFPKEDFIHGFKNQLEGQGISPLQAEAYSEVAERLARSAFRGGDQHQLLPVQPTSPTDRHAAEKFVESFGLRAFRRPLNSAEVAKYVRLLQLGAETEQVNPSNDHVQVAFQAGARLVVEAMLQSPHFLFRVHRRGSGGVSSVPTDSSQRAAHYERASRLSYLLWDTMPDDQLLQMAAEGKFTSSSDIAAQARRMLEDSRAADALDEFLAQWMRFDRVIGATRDRRRYREFNVEVAAAMVEETRQLFRHLVWNDQNFMEFFTADYTFVNANLAQLYGLPIPAEDFARVAYPGDSGRSGVLGHGSFLVSTSKPADTSPTARGLFIRNNFLAQEIAPPPPGVNAVLPEVSEDKPLTNRERLEVHLNSEACASCHRLIDPIGYGFEQYDAIGAYHEKVSLRFGSRDNPVLKELAVDTAGFIQGIDESMYSRPKELGKLLANNETCQRCIVKQYFRYAFGREETAADKPIIEDAYRRFRESGFHFRELIISMVSSPLFVQSEVSAPQSPQP